MRDRSVSAAPCRAYGDTGLTSTVSSQPQRRAQHALFGGIRAGELRVNAPAMHHHDAIAHAQQLRQLRRDHDDAGAARGQPIHQVVDLDLRADVDAARGLVEDEDAARARQPLPEHDLLLVAAAQLSNRLRGRRFHAAARR